MVDSSALLVRRQLHYSLLLIILVAYLIIPALLGPQMRLPLKLLFTLVVLFGLLAVYEEKKYRVLISLVALASVISKFIAHLIPDTLMINHVENLTAVACLFIVTFLILKTIITQKTVEKDTIVGAVAVYLMLGMMFAALYDSIEDITPNALAASAPTTVRDEQFYMYFSFITLSTVGYGDITPTSPLARTCSALEAITGQIYLTVLVALLIGKYLSKSNNS